LNSLVRVSGRITLDHAMHYVSACLSVRTSVCDTDERARLNGSGYYKKLSCRKKTVRLLHGSVLAEYNWKTIFCGQYRSVFNHCDVIGLQKIKLSNSVK